MAFRLPLPDPFPARGWKVKIRDLERNEPPHATILWRQRAWRFGLRERTFLDDAPVLCREWDAMYPENPIESKEEDDD